MYIYIYTHDSIMLYPNPAFAAMFFLFVQVTGVGCGLFGSLSKRANTRANMEGRDKP